MFIVRHNGKCGFLASEGKMLGNLWLDSVSDFCDDHADVWLDYEDENGNKKRQELLLCNCGHLWHSEDEGPAFNGYVGKYVGDGQFKFIKREAVTDDEAAFGKDARADDGKSASIVLLGNKVNFLDCNGRLVGNG